MRRLPFRRRRRQCGSAAVDIGAGWSATDYCTRDRNHDGPHANAFTMQAWVVVTHAKQVTYRYPYEHLRDDTVLALSGLGEPEYLNDSVAS